MMALTRKLLRDLAAMKGQMTAVALVMACGLMVMIMSKGLVRSLEAARDDYYERNRLADVFCELKRAPNALGRELARIPGVASVETRIRGSLTLDMPGMRSPVDGVILSMPDDRPWRINVPHLRRGRLPEPGHGSEVLISEAFATAHGLQPGHTLQATIYGARATLRIVGTALSPEFVYETRPGETVPDNRGFGIFWMNERALARAFGLEGAFNSVVATLAPGGATAAVKARLDLLLAPHGGRVSYDRTEHTSSKLIDDRIAILRGFALAFPAVFLTIAAFMTSAALTRLVRLQREQIAQLKSFGYSSAAVGWHYAQFALAAVLAATIIGTVIGLWLGHEMVVLYRRFFQFPELLFRPDWTALALALAASAGAAFLGVVAAVLQAAGLPPAEAMRPETPPRFGPSLLEKSGLTRLLPPMPRMVLRNLERKPGQALFTVLGLSLATAIPILPGAMGDGIAYLMDFQWTRSQRQDMTISLIEPASPAALHDLAHLPGVLHAEPFRTVPALLAHGHRHRRVGIIGIASDARLNRLLDDQGRPVSLPSSGLVLSAKLAEVLDLRPGDQARVEVQEGTRPRLTTVMVETVTDFSGLGAYMDIRALNRLMGEDRIVSGAYLALDTARTDTFLDRAKEVPAIASVVSTQAARKSFESVMGNMMDIVRSVYFSFAVIVSAGVVYNSARIALSERTRDLATLRVLGFSQADVILILLAELSVLTLAALGPGLVIGSELARLLVLTASTESVRMPLVVTVHARTTAVLIVLLASVASFALVARRVQHLDLLGVLKARE